MKKAGALLALIAGIFGTIAAVVTLFFGGLADAFETDNATTVIGLGWGGILFSFIVLVLGALSFSTQNKILGILLILSSLGGMILGGTLVAVCLVLSLIGGILVLLGGKKDESSQI
jgi:hypothetical protein